MEHAELIENAFVAYLKAVSPNPWTAGLLIFPGENNLDKSGQRIVAYVEGDLGAEDPPNSGNRWADVVVELRTPFSKDGDPLTGHKGNAAALQLAVTASTLPDLLNAAQSGFTCFGLASRDPFRKQDENFWSSGWKVRLYSCPSAISN